MKVGMDVKSEFTRQDIEQNYNRAAAMMQGMFTTSIACNTTVIPHWIGKTDCFWYLREFRCGRKQFRLVDANKNTNEIIFSHVTLALALSEVSGKSVDPEMLPLTKLKISMSPMTIEFDAFDKRWRFTGDDNKCIEIEGFTDLWLVSPDGTKAAFILDHNIWIRELITGEEYALTCDGEPFYSYASAPSAWGASVALGRPEALWSPDSKKLFTLQVDTRSVQTLPMIEHVPQDGSIRPKVVHKQRRLAFPGDEYIDEYRFLAINVETGKQQDASYHRCPVYHNAYGFFTMSSQGWWSDDNRHAYFIDIDRGGDHVARLVEFDTLSGATRVVIEEHCPETCFKLRLDSGFPILARPIPNSNEVLWYSQRSGWGHLYLYDVKAGQLKYPVTSGDWIVWSIHHYDCDNRELIIQTTGRGVGSDPYSRDICRVNIDSGCITSLVPDGHSYTVFSSKDSEGYGFGYTRDILGGHGVSPSGRFLVTTRSRVDETPVSLLIDNDGNELSVIETADISGLPNGWQWPELVKLRAADETTDIYGVVYRPSNFSAESSYPIVDVSWTHKEVCAIPTGSFTNDGNAGRRFHTASAFAELGFIVVEIYGRGTSGRCQAFSSAPNPFMPDSKNQADRVEGIRQLSERYPYMDIKRVGAGGLISSNVAVSGLLGYPNFYKVGVTNGGVSDQRLKSAFYTEAFGDFPACPIGHVDEFADRLQGKLLLMHGMMHPTIPVADPFRLIYSLQMANKDFDMLFLPNDGYGMSSYAIRRGWDYLVKHLLNVEPPRQFKLKTSVELIAEKFAQLETRTR